MKRRFPTESAGPPGICGIAENPAICGSIRNGKAPFPFPTIFRNSRQKQPRGYGEGDTVAGKKGKACLRTLVDRKSRYLTGGKAEKKTSPIVNAVLIQVRQGHPVRSLMPDGGKAFASHAAVMEAVDGVPFYVPSPHQPWQRGSNENTDGVLREYFLKGRGLTPVSETHVQAIFAELNHRPRKCLGYKTPYSVREVQSYSSIMLWA